VTCWLPSRSLPARGLARLPLASLCRGLPFFSSPFGLSAPPPLIASAHRRPKHRSLPGGLPSVFRPSPPLNAIDILSLVSLSVFPLVFLIKARLFPAADPFVTLSFLFYTTARALAGAVPAATNCIVLTRSPLFSSLLDLAQAICRCATPLFMSGFQGIQVFFSSSQDVYDRDSEPSLGLLSLSQEVNFLCTGVKANRCKVRFVPSYLRSFSRFRLFCSNPFLDDRVKSTPVFL